MAETIELYGLYLPKAGMAVDVEAQVEVDIDHQWGADADGNRGITRVFVEVHSLTITDYWGKKIPHKEWRDDSQYIEEAIIERAKHESGEA